MSHLAVVGVTLLAVSAGLLACSTDDSSPVPAPPAGTGPPSSPHAADPTPETVVHPVHFLDRRGRLVARTARVDALPNRMLAALDVAGTAPSEPGLRAAFPAAAFASVSFDGVHEEGAYGVRLRSRRFLDRPPELTPAQARTAVRAVVCTLQAAVGAEVTFYLRRRPVPRLFGQQLRDGTVEDGRCPA